MIIQAKINGSESDSDEDKIDFDLSLQSVLKDLHLIYESMKVSKNAFTFTYIFLISKVWSTSGHE